MLACLLRVTTIAKGNIVRSSSFQSMFATAAGVCRGQRGSSSF